MVKCPKCESTQITKIPSSTMPIDDKTKTYYGTKNKVPEKDWKIHKKTRFICNDCLYEW